MTGPQLEQLLRMAGEAARLERVAEQRLEASAWRGSRWLAVMTSVAAAACLVALLPNPASPPAQPSSSRNDVIVEASGPVEIQLTAHDSGQRVDVDFDRPADEPWAVVALVREFQRECQCLCWRLVELDGSAVARVMDDHTLQLTSHHASAGDEPEEALLVVAAARQPDGFVSQHSTPEQVVSCLNEAATHEVAGGDAVYAATVSACLPPGATVLASTFCRE